MKSLANLLRKAPDAIDKKQRAEYFGIYLSAVSAAFANVLLLLLFFFGEEYILTLFSVTGIMFWLSAAYLARRAKFSYAIYVGMFEMCMHVAVIVLTIGTAYGIQLILFTAIAYATLLGGQKTAITKALGLFTTIELTLLYTFMPKVTENQPYPGYEHWFFVFSALISSLPLVFVLLRMKSMQIIQRKKLQKQIYKDELTGLYNRLFLQELLDYELDVSARSRAPFCICFADVDYFKKINDTYGHAIGDEVLVELANTFSEVLRKSDVVCRWGGEEFVIVLPRCELKDAPLVIEKMRAMLASKRLSKEQLEVTLSYGIVLLNNHESIDEVFKRADSLLYLAKENGRDRIEIEQG